MPIINGIGTTSEPLGVARMRSSTLKAVAVLTIVLVSHSMAEAATTTGTTKEVAVSRDSLILNDAVMGKTSASIMGESALVDKETRRIFWEGGSTTLSASLAPFLDGYGVKHLKATLMSCIFLLALLLSIVARIRLLFKNPAIQSRKWRSILNACGRSLRW